MSRKGAIASNVASVRSNPLMQHVYVSGWVVSAYAWYALLLCRTLTSLTLLQHEHSCCQSLLLNIILHTTPSALTYVAGWSAC